MTVDNLPGEIVLPTRDDIIARWKRSLKIRVPDADVSDNTQPDVQARIRADALLPIYSSTKTIGANAVLEEAVGQAVDQWGEREGVGTRREAVGASGFVIIAASLGGGTIPVGDVLTDDDTGLKYKCIREQLYTNGSLCPVEGIDTGPGSNVDAGHSLKWSSPRPGIGQIAVVSEATDGSGLTGGREVESDDEYKSRILAAKAERAASGNDADYQQTAGETPGVSVQQVFTIPCVVGPGTTCVLTTVRPLTPGGSRIPNATQRSLIEAHVVGEMPGDDGAFHGEIAEESADVVFTVAWDPDAQGWSDVVPWPPYYPPASGPLRAIVVNTAASPSSFVLKTADSVYTSVAQPQPGQTIAFYDSPKAKFRRKRILSVVGTGPWTITADTSNDASDTGYTPVVGQRATPWSESLDALLPKLLTYFDGLGPGEQFATFYDVGRRQRRQPAAPKQWPHTLTAKALEGALDIPEILDRTLVEGDGATPTIGTPGVLSYMLKLRYVGAFAE
jgi:uncharacterized phage protein gp47/JayE